MWNVCSFFRNSLFAACLLAATGDLASAQVATNGARASLSGLVGVWRGDAVLNGDPTPVWVEFSSCERGVCGRLTLPDLGTERLPLGPVGADDQGRLSASMLSVMHEGDRLVGSLAGASSDMFIAAMGHGEGPASVSLSRSAPPSLDVREEDVTFHNGEIALAGTLVRPPRGAGPFPAVIAVLGSGPAARWYSLSRARDWARLGYAVLIYDKRGSGASGGDWQTSSLDDLADDVVAAFRFLRVRHDIRADRVGLWAHSQGGWVAPRAIARGADVAFLIAVSGGGATPLQIEHYGYARRLAHMGVQGAELARANATIDHYFSYLAGDIDLAALRAFYNEVRTTPWFAGLGVAQITPLESVRAQWRWVPTYDPAADIANLRVPTLVMLAGSDGDTPLRDAVSGWTSALGRSATHDARLLVYPEVDHHMGVASGRGWRRVSSAYENEVARFLTLQRSR